MQRERMEMDVIHLEYPIDRRLNNSFVYERK
jgi:hypothetical protein